MLIHLILAMGEKSIWKGLLGHFRRRIDTPSAFVQQRQKLLPSALEDLFHRFSDQLRPQKKFRGYRLLAADCSSLKSGAYPADKDAYHIKFECLMKRRGKKRATIAIARMILTAIYAMLSTGEIFNPSDLKKFDMPEDLKGKQTLSSAKETVKLLVSLDLVPAGSISLDALAGSVCSCVISASLGTLALLRPFSILGTASDPK